MDSFAAATAVHAALTLMVGVPDDGLVPLLEHEASRQLFWVVPGNSSFPSQLEPHFTRRLKRVFFGPTIPLRPAAGARGVPLVNNICDPDTSAIALDMLDRLLDAVQSPCFNHPRAVLDTGRDRVAATLAGLPGLHVPRTIKVRLEEPADLVRLVETNGLDWPVIVRVAGVHGGHTTVRVDTADEAKCKLAGIPWGGRELYVTQYVAYQDDDGRHRKLRLVVAGRRVLLRHLVVADDWHVHAQDRNDAAAAEELAALEGFDHDLRPRIEATMLAVADALQLDFFGMDCSLRPDGRLLMFEANAAMNILHNSQPSPNRWDVPIKAIRDALSAVLFDPSQWRFAEYRPR